MSQTVFRFRLVSADGTLTEPSVFGSTDDSWVVGDVFPVNNRIFRIREIRIGEDFRPDPAHQATWVVEPVVPGNGPHPRRRA